MSNQRVPWALGKDALVYHGGNWRQGVGIPDGRWEVFPSDGGYPVVAPKGSRTAPLPGDEVDDGAEIARLKSQLAAAMVLRLGRAFTLAEIEKHEGEGGLWLIDDGDDGTFRTVEASVSGGLMLNGAPMSLEDMGRTADCIAVDLGGNPCPPGGWSEVTP